MSPPDALIVIRITIIAGLASWLGQIVAQALCQFEGWR